MVLPHCCSMGRFGQRFIMVSDLRLSSSVAIAAFVSKGIKPWMPTVSQQQGKSEFARFGQAKGICIMHPR